MATWSIRPTSPTERRSDGPHPTTSSVPTEIDDITDSLRRPDGDVDGEFDALVAELDDSDIDVRCCSPNVRSTRTSRSGCRPISTTIASARQRSRSPRRIGRRDGWPRPCCPCSTLPRRRSSDIPDEVGPLLNQMLAELKKHGLESLDLEGKPFDPEFAEAVAHEPGDGGEPMVSEVLRSGYTWKGRVLRAAMVRTRD